MIRKVTFYWLLLTLVLIDSWLLSKPNILGKIGLLIYKYHYLRSFPRTLLTVWLVVSSAVLIVLLIQFLVKRDRISKGIGTAILAACAVGSLLVLCQVYIDFTSWSYSHTGWKFRYGAHLLPGIVVFVFANGLAALLAKTKVFQQTSDRHNVETLSAHDDVSPDTSLPLQP
jgi:hypothetical protein